jgi:hypothetical protein
MLWVCPVPHDTTCFGCHALWKKPLQEYNEDHLGTQGEAKILARHGGDKYEAEFARNTRSEWQYISPHHSICSLREEKAMFLGIVWGLKTPTNYMECSQPFLSIFVNFQIPVWIEFIYYIIVAKKLEILARMWIVLKGDMKRHFYLSLLKV